MADGRRLVPSASSPVAAGSPRTGDPGREGLLVTEGWIERMPSALEHTLVDAERGDGAWWILMRDVSELLWPAEGAHHARGEQSRADGGGPDVDGLLGGGCARRRPSPGGSTSCRPRWRGASEGLDLLPNQLEAAWEAFAEAAPRDVADPVLAVLADPEPLAAWLEARGVTLLHGDLRDEHLGRDGTGGAGSTGASRRRAIQVADLTWYLMHCAWRIEATRDEIVDDFRRARGEADDPQAIEVGLLTGLIQYGWILGHSALIHPDPAEQAWAREEPAWWVRGRGAPWPPGRRGTPRRPRRRPPGDADPPLRRDAGDRVDGVHADLAHPSERRRARSRRRTCWAAAGPIAST